MPSNGFALKNMGHNIAYNMFLCNFASSSLPVVTSLCLCGKGCPAGGEVLTYNNKESVGADATGLAPTVRPQLCLYETIYGKSIFSDGAWRLGAAVGMLRHGM